MLLIFMVNRILDFLLICLVASFELILLKCFDNWAVILLFAGVDIMGDVKNDKCITSAK